MANSLEELKKLADLIYDAKEVGENSANRVGKAFKDIAECFEKFKLIYRVSDNGFEFSTDGGNTWKLAIALNDMPIKFKNITQSEYDALVESGKTDDKTYYCIFEE